MHHSRLSSSHRRRLYVKCPCPLSSQNPAASFCKEMPPPKDLPGFYFDPEKNRYFPIKGPIPGAKRSYSSSLGQASCRERSDRNQKHRAHWPGNRKQIKPPELLRLREIHGRLLFSKKCRHNFEQEYQKFQASFPVVWKYQRAVPSAVSALEQLHGVVQTPRGLEETKFLTMGNMIGTIRLFEIGNVGRYFDYGLECKPGAVWPPSSKHEAGCDHAIRSIWHLTETFSSFDSGISCIRKIATHSDDQQALWNFGSLDNMNMVTALGSGLSRGSVCILNLSEPLDLSLVSSSLASRISRIASFESTIWTADCNSNRKQAVIGTNLGAALIDLETRGLSWMYRSKSNILSLQFDQSGNVVLCGHRNGAVIAVDIRERQRGYSDLSAGPSPRIPDTHRTAHAHLARNDKRSTKFQALQHRETSNSSNAVFMSSAICSLVALQSYDQYFLGSSMDGSIKLFDCRLLQRGAVQSYEGHVNSHSRLQLGVNPSETLVMSGGEDHFLRTWSIKTSELVFEEKFSNSVLATICWPRSGSNSYGVRGSLKQPECYSEGSYELTHSWGAWLGSGDALLYAHGT
ncbi:uncharacterized protein LOC103696415 [Phoenix dactylifera]|uniref:Uncharacterized protein LOC103696415 n=1 Tax=Phoenix dactylifera TaxID=42345 RepID=A0A8B9AW70_PHODC|nr:uncharacterized protein LOC103696415 [Phoenix dactylifera]